MGRFKLTSPGMLLILSVIAAGGIFLLDLFYLKPVVESQKESAFKEQSARVKSSAAKGLRNLEEGLSNSATSWSHNPKTHSMLAGRTSRDAFDDFAKTVLDSSGADVVWLTNADGKLVNTWSSRDHVVSQSTVDMFNKGLGSAVQVESQVTGLAEIPGGLAIFSRARVINDKNQYIGKLWLARYIGEEVYQQIASGMISDIVLVTGQKQPPESTWFLDDGNAMVTWPVSDVFGSYVGYFRANVPVGNIVRQATTARRMVLIVMSLSVGLVLLIVLGTHMLITGPVLRLLRRLQELESGEGKADDLVRDLHGEPLVLARRLESAFDRLAHMSRTDELTSLANRRHFDEVLSCFYTQARRYNRPLSLIIIDVDFFKAINDSIGHQGGDEVLRHVAAAIEEVCRKADLPARYGGDEFAILLPETGSEEAATVAERIRSKVSENSVVKNLLKMQITLSVGVTDLNAGEIDSPHTMKILADKALYAAKELGRNRVVMAHDLTGVNWSKSEHATGNVDAMCKKLAGLDTRFKDLFLMGITEIVDLLEKRDPNMADHARKVKHYSVLIAREMELPERLVKRIEIAASLHDIGMIALPDSVLLCPGHLDAKQLEMMRKHTLLGVRMMEGMEFLDQEVPAVRYHHERYDGKGYPEGISGAAIPLSARILAVADCFDAMTSHRTFRTAKSRTDALREIRNGSGTQFDPAVVDAFMSVADRLGEDLMEISEDDAPLDTCLAGRDASLGA